MLSLPGPGQTPLISHWSPGPLESPAHPPGSQQPLPVNPGPARHARAGQALGAGCAGHSRRALVHLEGWAGRFSRHGPSPDLTIPTRQGLHPLEEAGSQGPMFSSLVSGSQGSNLVSPTRRAPAPPGYHPRPSLSTPLPPQVPPAVWAVCQPQGRRLYQVARAHGGCALATTCWVCLARISWSGRMGTGSRYQQPKEPDWGSGQSTGSGAPQKEH